MNDFFEKYRKICDLVYFDGPLLSLFTNHNLNKFYLLKWVDIAIEEHIWLKFQVKYALLEKYLKKELSEYELIKNAIEISIITIDENLKITSNEVVSFQQIQPSYLPEEDVLFDEDLTFDRDKIFEFIGLFENKLESIYQNYRIVKNRKYLNNNRDLILSDRIQLEYLLNQDPDYNYTVLNNNSLPSNDIVSSLYLSKRKDLYESNVFHKDISKSYQLESSNTLSEQMSGLNVKTVSLQKLEENYYYYKENNKTKYSHA